MVTNFWLLWPVLVFGGCVAGQGVRGVSTPGLSDADTPFLLPITAADSVKITGALSADRAVAVAFAHGNRMQLLAAELELAGAERAEYGRIDDPVLGGKLGKSPHGSALELEIHQEVSQFILRPARTLLGDAEFSAARERISGRARAEAMAVRIAYYDVLRKYIDTATLRLLVESVEAAFALAQTLHEAGNISELELATRQESFESARLELARSESAAAAQRELLNALMGVWGHDTQWTLPDHLPSLPEEKFDVVDLEARAVANRADLHVAKFEQEASGRALAIARTERWIGGMELGLSAEREEGTWTFGPSFAVRLPLFSGTEVRRRRADYLRAQQALAVQAVEIRAEVRAARERLLAARERVAHYRDVLLPLKQRIVRLVQREYNFMLSSPFDLLDARRAEIAAQREHISALGDYWIARVQLQAAIGEKLASTTGEN